MWRPAGSRTLTPPASLREGGSYRPTAHPPSDQPTLPDWVSVALEASEF
jgi:hypothetical protein